MKRLLSYKSAIFVYFLLFVISACSIFFDGDMRWVGATSTVLVSMISYFTDNYNYFIYFCIYKVVFLVLLFLLSKIKKNYIGLILWLSSECILSYIIYIPIALSSNSYYLLVAPIIILVATLQLFNGIQKQKVPMAQLLVLILMLFLFVLIFVFYKYPLLPLYFMGVLIILLTTSKGISWHKTLVNTVIITMCLIISVAMCLPYGTTILSGLYEKPYSERYLMSVFFDMAFLACIIILQKANKWLRDGENNQNQAGTQCPSKTSEFDCPI